MEPVDLVPPRVRGAEGADELPEVRGVQHVAPAGLPRDAGDGVDLRPEHWDRHLKARRAHRDAPCGVVEGVDQPDEHHVGQHGELRLEA
eukprot:4314857-Alexandrium_andersonii.AAC.1